MVSDQIKKYIIWRTRSIGSADLALIQLFAGRPLIEAAHQSSWSALLPEVSKPFRLFTSSAVAQRYRYVQNNY